MARKKRTYGKRKKVNLIPVIIILFTVLVFIVLTMKFFASNDYISQINYALSSEIKLISGKVSKISEVDTKVYTNDGITYTNQHKGKIGLNTFNGSVSSDLNKTEKAKNLLEGLKNLNEDLVVSELPSKQDGYYWINVNIVVENNFLIFKKAEEFNFNLYYDIEEERVYVKEKYHHEFNKKNNKLKLQGYKVDENYKKLIEELIN